MDIQKPITMVGCNVIVPDGGIFAIEIPDGSRVENCEFHGNVYLHMDEAGRYSFRSLKRD